MKALDGTPFLSLGEEGEQVSTILNLSSGQQAPCSITPHQVLWHRHFRLFYTHTSADTARSASSVDGEARRMLCTPEPSGVFPKRPGSASPVYAAIFKQRSVLLPELFSAASTLLEPFTAACSYRHSACCCKHRQGLRCTTSLVPPSV